MTPANGANAVHELFGTEDLFPPANASIDLLLGPYRSGKTWHLIERIVEIHERNPFANTIVVVPSQRYQTVFEQRLVESLKQRSVAGSEMRGLVGLRIMNFYSLVQLLFRSAGNAFRLVPEQIRPAIISRVSSALKEKNELNALSQISSFVGTQQNILALIDEFERAALSPDDVLEQVSLSAQTDSRYVELAKIYKLYWQELRRLNLMDERQVAFALRESLNLESSLPGWQQDASIFVDGFDRFNKLQLQIFAELGRLVEKMTISFDYAEQDGKIHPDYVWKESSYVALHSQLRGQLSVERFEGKLDLTKVSSSRFAVTDRFLEMEEVARRVKESIVRGKTAPEKILVVVRSLKNYGNAIRAAFDDAGLNYFVDEAVEVAKLPVIQHLLRLLSVHDAGLLRRDVIDCLRSHYLSSKLGLESWHVDEIDRRSMRDRLVGGSRQWLDLFDRAKRRLIENPKLDEEPSVDDADYVDDAKGIDVIGFDGADELARKRAAEAPVIQDDFLTLLQAKLTSFFERVRPLEAATASEHVKWAENVIDHVFEPFFSKPGSFGKRPCSGQMTTEWMEQNKEFQKWIEQKALGEFRRCLSSMLLEEAYLGSQKISAKEFIARLDRLLTKSNFRPVPPVKNAVIVCGADLAPNRSFDEVYVAGLVEGEFPRKNVAAGFVGADEITRWASFGIDISNPRFHPGFESALFLNLVGRAKQRVHLSYPLYDLGGEELLPSLLLGDGSGHDLVEVFGIFSQAAFNPVSARNVIAGAMSKLGTAASLERRFEVLESLWSGSSGNRTASLVEQLSENIALTHGRLATSRLSVYNGVLTDYVETGALRVPLPERWSATRLSEYGKCGFRFWVSHVLDSEPVEEPQSGLDHKLLGEIYHKALELFYKRLLQQNRLVTDDPALINEFFQQSINEAVDWLERESKFRQGEFWQFEKMEIRFRLSRFLRREIQRAQRDKFQFVPKLLEASFGVTREENSFPPLIINDGKREIGIGGRIDRIDLACEDSAAPIARLVDYKKGASLITADEAYRGRNLQLALYALAVEKTILPKVQVVEGVYLSVSSGAPTGKLKFGSWKKSDDSEKPDLLAQTESYVRDFVHEIERGNFAVDPNGLDLCKRCRHKPVCRITELDVPSNPQM